MRAIEAKSFSGYGGLRQIELPKPQPAKDRVLVHVAAAGVTPLDHTILSGGHPRAKAPLVLGNEGAGVIEDAGDSGLVFRRLRLTAYGDLYFQELIHFCVLLDALGGTDRGTLPERDMQC